MSKASDIIEKYPIDEGKITDPDVLVGKLEKAIESISMKHLKAIQKDVVTWLKSSSSIVFDNTAVAGILQDSFDSFIAGLEETSREIVDEASKSKRF